MGTYYTLVNHTKKEWLSFAKISGMKIFEIARNSTSCAITTYYMLTHVGDRISFVPDDIEPEWPFPDGSSADLYTIYKDVTDDTLNAMLEKQIIEKVVRS